MLIAFVKDVEHLVCAIVYLNCIEVNPLLGELLDLYFNKSFKLVSIRIVIMSHRMILLSMAWRISD
jgi:hypothetical protein